jgi:hypothetical protein
MSVGKCNGRTPPERCRCRWDYIAVRVMELTHETVQGWVFWWIFAFFIREGFHFRRFYDQYR